MRYAILIFLALIVPTQAASEKISKQSSAANKVNKTGDTMTGTLVVSSSVIANEFSGDGSGLTNVKSTTSVAEAYANNGTLGVGTAFYSFTPIVDITLRRLVATIYEPGSTGSSVFRCGDGTNFIDVTVSGTDSIGQRNSTAINKNVVSGTEVLCSMFSSTQDDTPTVALSLLFSPS